MSIWEKYVVFYLIRHNDEAYDVSILFFTLSCRKEGGAPAVILPLPTQSPRFFSCSIIYLPPAMTAFFILKYCPCHRLFDYLEQI